MSPLEPDQKNPSYKTALGANEPTHAKGMSRMSNETERWLRSAMHNASDMITVLDADRTIHDVSPAAERIIGYSPEELVGTLAFDYVHPKI
jgi:PAS domain-containing protein